MKHILLLMLCAMLVACTFAEPKSKYSDVKQLQVGIKYRPPLCDRKTQDGDTVEVHYTGKLPMGMQFDSSLTRGEPFSFKIGAGMVIKGWDLGLLGACVGEKRKLVIPPHLGYGANGAGRIPGNSVLIFDIEVLKIKNE